MYVHNSWISAALNFRRGSLFVQEVAVNAETHLGVALGVTVECLALNGTSLSTPDPTIKVQETPPEGKKRYLGMYKVSPSRVGSRVAQSLFHSDLALQCNHASSLRLASWAGLCLLPQTGLLGRQCLLPQTGLTGKSQVFSFRLSSPGGIRTLPSDRAPEWSSIIPTSVPLG